MPTASVMALNVAAPLTRLTGVWATPSMVKVTVPVGGLDRGVGAVTVAVKVTGWPAGAGVGDAVSIVVVAGGWNSTAPMSAELLTMRRKPRWSVVRPATRVAWFTPRSTTKLPARGAL